MSLCYKAERQKRKKQSNPHIHGLQGSDYKDAFESALKTRITRSDIERLNWDVPVCLNDLSHQLLYGIYKSGNLANPKPASNARF